MSESVHKYNSPVVRATRSQAEGIIADTAGQQWEPQPLVPRPMALTVLTTTVTMRTAIGLKTRRAHADGGWLALVTAVALADRTANTGSSVLRLRPAIGIVRH